MIGHGRKLLAAAATALVVAPAQGSAVWFTDGTTVLRLLTGTGAIVSVRAPAPVRAIAPETDGGAWVLGGARLVRMTSDLSVSIDFPASDAGADTRAVLAPDPHTGGVWVAEGDTVRLHAADGVAVTQWQHDEPVQSIAVGGPSAIWIASPGGITRYDANGQRTGRSALVGAAPQSASSLLLDRVGGYLWHVAEHAATQLDVLAGMAVRTRVMLPGAALAAGVDAASGALWILYEDDVQAIDRDGVAAVVRGRYREMEQPRSLAADPSARLTWIGDAIGLAAVDPTTLQWFRVTAGMSVSAVAVAPLALRPSVVLDAPDAQAAIRLRIGAACGAEICAQASRYIESLSLRATIDGEDATRLFSKDRAGDSATLAELPPEFSGASAFAAIVTDVYGVASDPVVAGLPLDGLGPMRQKANALPVVSLTAPANNASFVAPAIIAINATASDSDGTVAKVEFLRDGVLLGTDTTAPYAYTWSNVPAGVYKLTARAYDNGGVASTSPIVTVQVKANVVPTVRITAPANNAAYTAPATIAIAVTATDADGTIGKVDFYQGATKIGTDTTSPFGFTWNNVGGGTYSLTAKATDDKGGVGASAAIVVKVNKPPTANVTAPANNASFAAPANITLQASAADADGTVSKVEFFRNGTLLATDTASPYSHVWNNVPIGTYTITARSTDNLGARTTSAPVTVAVAANKPPVVALTAPTNGATFVDGVPITVAASASDPDGTISRVDFRLNDGISDMLIAYDTTSPYSAVMSVGVGSYTITAVATDGKGATTVSAPVTVTGVANQLPVVALVSPTANHLVVSQTPPSIPLEAAASDADGGIAVLRIYMQPQPMVEGDAPALLAAFTAPPYEAVWPDVPLTEAWTDGRWIDHFEVWAEATDFAGATAVSDLAYVRVVASVPRTVTITMPREPLFGGVEFASPATIVLSATASQAPGSGPIAKVEFLADGVGVATASPNAPNGEYMATWRDVPQGVRSVVARLTEADGTVVDSHPLQIRIRALNQSPVVALTAPTNGEFFGPLFGVSSIPAAATASDPDGNVQTVTFLDNGRPYAGVAAVPYSATLAASSGVHVINAVARDDRLADAISRPAFTYIPHSRRPPFAVITGPMANSTVNAGASVTITADVVAPDGTIELVEFYDGPFRLGQKTAPPWTYTTSVFEGVHAFRVFAAQAFAADTWSEPVFVNAVATGGGITPAVALSSPTDGQVFMSPATVPLSVSVSDPQGRLTRVDYVAGAQTIASSAQPPFAATWSTPGPGDFEVAAIGRFDANGKIAVSLPRSFSVRQDEFVELLEPAAGALSGPGAPVVLRARAGIRAGVTRIDFIADGNVLGSAAVTGAPSVASAQFTWNVAPVGAHAVQARAFATDGSSKSMLPIHIAVASLSVDVVEPYAGQVYLAPGDVRIMADPKLGTGDVAQVDFYGDGVLLGSRSAVPYVFLWAGVGTGSHVVSARVRDSGGATVLSAPVTVSVAAGAALQVDPGVDGSNVADDSISFGGTVAAPANSAVIVNGRLAPHDRNGRFFATSVALKPGANTVTLVLNAQDGAPVTRTIVVGSTATAPFRVRVDECEGLAPFAPTLTISNPGNVAFQRVEIDMQDDGTSDVTLASLPGGTARVTLNYPSPGTYTTRVTAYATNGSTLFQTKLKLKATAPAELASTVVGVYRSLIDRMSANNAATALNLFVGDAQSRYADVFTALAGSLPSVAAQLGTPIDGVVTGDWAELTLVRPTAAGDRVFPIYLIRGGDGLWRVESM
jgi:hypothetical protein